MKNKNHKIAIIDLGSNSVRLIIFIIYKGKYYKLIEQEKEMVRLSEDMASDGCLKEEPVQRTLLTLSLFRDLITSHKASKVILTATAAVRNACNQKEFLDIVQKEFDWNFEVISGEREAWLGFLGVVNSINTPDYFLVDIGGASTEVSLIKGRELVESYSINVGAVTYYEKKEDFLDQLSALQWLSAKNNLPVIGLGGTIRSFAKIYTRNSGYPLEKLHNLEISALDAEKTIHTVITKKPDQLHKINGLDKSRTDIIIPGLSIFSAILSATKPEKVIISGNGLREGLLFEYLLQDKQTPIYKNVRNQSIRNLIHSYDMDQEHVEHIAFLAKKLCVLTQHLHKIPKDNLYILKSAALLHDIGIYIDYYSHHRHSFYLIMNSSLYGFTHRETLLLAYIAARHRNKSFKVNYHEYKMILDKDDLFLINVFSLFLRIAENLDRNEEANITDLHLEENQSTMTLWLESEKNISLEINAAMKSAPDFKKLFGKNLQLLKKELPQKLP